MYLNTKILNANLAEKFADFFKNKVNTIISEVEISEYVYLNLNLKCDKKRYDFKVFKSRHYDAYLRNSRCKSKCKIKY